MLQQIDRASHFANNLRTISRICALSAGIGDNSSMTVLDERSRVPPLDKRALERLARALDREGVVSASLMGSRARGVAGPLSDLDIGVWHEQGLDPDQRLELRLALAQATTAAAETSEVDIVMLNEATPLMRHRAVRDGQRLTDRDPRTRVGLETKAILDYLDTAPLRAELARGLRHRIEEGRFGRR